MNNLFLTLNFSLLIAASGQKPNSSICERSATDYFFQSVFPADFPKSQEIVYSGHTEEKLFSFGLFRPCAEIESLINSTTEKDYDAGGQAQVKSLPLSFKVKTTSRFSRKLPTVSIYNAVQFGSSSIVPIVVTTFRKESICYFISLSPACSVIKFCKVKTIQ